MMVMATPRSLRKACKKGQKPHVYCMRAHNSNIRFLMPQLSLKAPGVFKGHPARLRLVATTKPDSAGPSALYNDTNELLSICRRIEPRSPPNARAASVQVGVPCISLDRPYNVAGPNTTICLGWVGCGWLGCLLYTSPSPRDGLLSRMPSSA